MNNAIAIPRGVLLLALLAAPGWCEEPPELITNSRPISHWIRLLSSEEIEDRRLAIFSIHRVASEPGAKVAAPALIKALTDKDVPTRKLVVESIERIGPAAREAEPQLRKMLQIADETWCPAAAAALAGIGAETKTVAPILIAYIRSRRSNNYEEHQAQRVAFDALGKLKDTSPEVVPFLQECLSDEYLRRPALWALERLGMEAKAAVPHLTKMLNHPNKDIGHDAFKALARMGPEGVVGMLPALKPGHQQTHHVCVFLHGLGKEGKVAVPALILLVDDPKSWCYMAAFALGGIGPEAKAAIPSLLKFMARRPADLPLSYHNIPAVALSKIDLCAEGVVPALLGLMGGGEPRHEIDDILKGAGWKIFPQLFAALNHRDVRIEGRAAGYLVALGEEVIPHLTKGLKDAAPRLRASCARTLGRMGPKAESAVPALIESLRDNEANVRSGAASSLARLGPPARVAVPALCKTLQEDDAGFVRVAAASTLAQLGSGSKEAMPALTMALKDRDAGVRNTAISGLRTLRADSNEVLVGLTAAVADTETRVRLNAIVTLAQLGPKADTAVPALTLAVKDPNPQIRAEAVTCLGAIGRAAESAVPTLRDALQDKEVEVRKRVQPALKQIAGCEVSTGVTPK